ncbi:carbamoyl-phosphate synthase large subunit [Pseudothermotoga thermarum]|uniref:Carbamoyl phosphate synthase large chain n=1 Tax=Pseudothermotoga thermarum DSM 5069 TaxID=688269 RepID=F7YU16_9THEM|nr:carbamoyl-phosphate synthase large subunit [Pseudothermotoga thermarum]AEH51599.1 carbamoyl-phosphate synthase large subunit [Pseudothermotoga thermarum DSM 5069]
MPRRNDIKRILVIGSGPITIGQAAEFDYSGSQALKALKKAGYYTIVVNSNSATIMTDPQLSDAVYIEPLTVEFLEKIIAKERPDAILPTLGGQTGLNLAAELAEKGILEKYGVQLIGVNLESIKKAEDRELFKQAMLEAGLEVLRSRLVSSVEEALAVVEEYGYPVVIRPSFTLGGTGGGIAYNRQDLERIVATGIAASPVGTVLIEESVIGWKEYELEVMKDSKGNFIVVCSIENFDPMGIHTGDSITVAPSQTLTDVEYQKMRNWAKAAMKAIGMTAGGANIQFAVNPENGRMVVIEMNPRVSRSSALASKATGYPIAKIAALLAVGYTLDEIPNDITGKTTAAFEPTIDYVVVKIPRFQMEKFPGADERLGTQMKSIGEVMAIGRTFKEAIGKALRALELDIAPELDLTKIDENLANPTWKRLSYIFAAFRKGYSVEDVHRLTKIDKWFLTQLKETMDFENKLKKEGLNEYTLRIAKEQGFSDREIAQMFGKTEKEIRKLREKYGIFPVFKMVDTCAAEFEAKTPYFYSTYNGVENESKPSNRKKILILGSGPNRIGQGIEFDYANVHTTWAFQEEGYEVIMVNSNPETVSTDYDTSDKLYFEPLTTEDVLEIIRLEQPMGVVVSFGGQTPLKIAKKLAEEGIKILGTNFESIDLAEDREKFAVLLKNLGIKCPPFRTATSVEDALKAAKELGFPVLVRPSFVLGGRAMVIIDSEEKLEEYVRKAIVISDGHPILIDKFLENAIEFDVDVVSDGKSVWIAGIMEQIQEAGVHSGDSACVLPPISISDETIEEIENVVFKLVKALRIIGPANVQLAVKDGQIYVLEANPRASRTFPFVSKAIGIPVAEIAAKVMIGKSLKDLLKEFWPYPARRDFDENSELLPTPIPKYYAVKEVIVPFSKFLGTDVTFGPEMKSTGEVMGFGQDFAEAFIKAEIAAGNFEKRSKTILVSIADKDKRKFIPLLVYLKDIGFEIVATTGTAKALKKVGVNCKEIKKDEEKDIVRLFRERKIDIVVVTNSPQNVEQLNGSKSFGRLLRTLAVQYRIPCITSYELFSTLVITLKKALNPDSLSVIRLNDLHALQKVVINE